MSVNRTPSPLYPPVVLHPKCIIPQFQPSVVTGTASRSYSNTIARCIRKLGKSLTNPPQTGFKSIVDLFNGKVPYSNSTQFIFHCACLSLYTAICLIPAGVGVLLMGVANLFRAPMTFIRPEHVRALPTTVQDDLMQNGFKICTFNLGLLPTCMSAVNGLDCVETRIKAIIDYINNKLPEQPDCICLQELFDEEGLEELINDPRIQEKFPYIIAGAGRKTAGISSGLAILSKYPIDTPEFRSFTSLCYEDNFSQKGVLSVRLHLSKTQHIRLINTHFQAKAQKDAQELRREEMKGLDQLEEMYMAEGDSTVLVAGDLNLSPFKNPTEDEDKQFALQLLKAVKNQSVSRQNNSIQKVFQEAFINLEWQHPAAQNFLQKHYEVHPGDPQRNQNWLFSFREHNHDLDEIRGTLRAEKNPLDTGIDQVDHILVRKHDQSLFTSGRFIIDRQPIIPELSDHFPLFARLGLKPPPIPL